MEKIVKLLIKKRSQVIFFLFLIAFYGAYSYYVIPKQENPNTAVAAAVITTVYPGASPEEVESAVTERLDVYKRQGYCTDRDVPGSFCHDT